MVPGTIGSGTGLTYSQHEPLRPRGALCADCAQPDRGAGIFTDSGAGWTEQKLSAQDADEDDLLTLSGFDRHRVRRGVRSDRCMA